MAKIPINLLEIEIVEGSGPRRSPKPKPPKPRKVRHPKARVTAELPQGAQVAGWHVDHAPKGKRNWHKDLGSVLKCPYCGAHFIKELCKTQTPEDLYWEVEKHVECPDSVVDAVLVPHRAVMNELAVTSGLEDADDIIKCWRCQRAATRTRWTFRHKLNTKNPWQNKAKLVWDDEGAQVPPTQQCLADRAEGTNPPEVVLPATRIKDDLRASGRAKGLSEQQLDELVERRCREAPLTNPAKRKPR